MVLVMDERSNREAAAWMRERGEMMEASGEEVGSGQVAYRFWKVLEDVDLLELSLLLELPELDILGIGACVFDWVVLDEYVAQFADEHSQGGRLFPIYILVLFCEPLILVMNKECHTPAHPLRHISDHNHKPAPGHFAC